MSIEKKKEFITIAKQLEYGKKIIKKIQTANTEYEIMRILHDARLSF